jgi:hypothetical protein
MISLPLFDVMTHHEVAHVVECLHAVIGGMEPAARWRKPSHNDQYVPVAYRGVAATAGEIVVE